MVGRYVDCGGCVGERGLRRCNMGCGGCAVGYAARGFSRTRITGDHSMLDNPCNNPCHRLAQSAINSFMLIPTICMQVSPWKTK